jgi:ribosome biogenesis protein Nip4
VRELVLLLPEFNITCCPSTAALQETKMVFEKLYKFIGKDIKSMIERPDGRYCLRLHKNKVYYVSEALMKKATNVSSSHKHTMPSVVQLGLKIAER